MKTKTRKTPLMMAEAYSLSVWPSSFALESKLSRNLESHTGLVPRLRHHEWKNSEKREQSQTCLSFAEVHPVFAESKNPASLKNHFSRCNAGISGCAAGFLGFSFFKCEIPQGLMVGLQTFHRGACSPGEKLQTQHQRRQSHTWRKGFQGFC